MVDFLAVALVSGYHTCLLKLSFTVSYIGRRRRSHGGRRYPETLVQAGDEMSFGELPKNFVAKIQALPDLEAGKTHAKGEYFDEF